MPKTWDAATQRWIEDTVTKSQAIIDAEAEAARTAASLLRGSRTVRGSEFDASLRPRSFVSAIGDSIINNAGAWPLQTARSVLTWAAYASGGRMRVGQWYAQAGATASTIRDNVLPSLLTSSPKPPFVLVLAGTNDSGSVVSFATTVGAIRDMYEAVKGMGSTPIAATIPPRTSGSAAQDLLVHRINAWITRHAEEQGYPFVDFYAVLVDPTNGNYRANYATDGIHPDSVACKLMGAALWNVLSPNFPTWTPRLPSDNMAEGQLLSNPLFLTDTNADGVPDGWTKAGADTHTASLVTGDTAILGNWMQLDKTAGTAINSLASGTMAVNVGDRLEFCGRMRVENLASTASKVYIYLHNGANSNQALIVPAWQWDQNATAAIFCGEGVVPSGWTSVKVTAYITGGTGRFAVSQLAVRNLTALGVA